MAYGIMRVEKRGRGAVYGLQIEATRDEKDSWRVFDASDIDWQRTAENVRLRDCRAWNEEITRELREAGLKERKDSVVMLDALYTASPDFFEDKSREEIVQYFRECLEYHEKTYGHVFSAVIHFDEKTPHMQIASVPIFEDERGKHLSAKLLMGGREDYRARQDSFFEDVSKKYGLERGEIRDPAETRAHVKVAELRAATQEAKIEDQERQIGDLTRRIASKKQAEKDVDKAAADKQQQVEKLDARIDMLRTQTGLFEAETEEAEQKEAETRKAAEIAQKQLEEKRGELDRVRDQLLQLKEQEQRLVRRNEKFEVEGSGTSRLFKAIEGELRAPIPDVEIVARHEAKKGLFTGDRPETVEITADSLKAVQEAIKQHARNEVVLQRFHEDTQKQTQAAADLLRNQKDAHEVAVDSRVREIQETSDREIGRLRRDLSDANKEITQLRADRAADQRQIDTLRADLNTRKAVLDFFPDQWQEMQERTAFARELEELYSHAQDNVPDSRISFSRINNRTYFELSDGREVGYKKLLEAYRDTCTENHIAHNPDMWKHLERLEGRDDRGFEH